MIQGYESGSGSGQPVSHRDTRYQGAIVRDHHLLLLRGVDHIEGKSFWLFPGGGRFAGETEEECVRREMFEETLLDVRVDRLLMEENTGSEKVYRMVKTYLCTPISGTAGPGTEPEVRPDEFVIEDVGWFDLRNERSWDRAVVSDYITYPQMVRVAELLGYRTA